MKDLMYLDNCNEEVTLLRQSNSAFYKLNENQKKLTLDLQERLVQLDMRNQEMLLTADLVDQKSKEALLLLEKQIKQERTKKTIQTIGGSLIGAAVGIVVIIIFKQ